MEFGLEVSRLPEVDPHDEAIRRWVVQHYRFDPERHEHRIVTVAAYDNEADFEAAVEALRGVMRARVDSRDRIAPNTSAAWSGRRATRPNRRAGAPSGRRCTMAWIRGECRWRARCPRT